MKKVFLIFGILGALLVLGLTGLLLIRIDFLNPDDLDEFIETKMTYLTARGAAVLFLKDGEITWTRNYGFADQEAVKPVTDSTVFHVASLSKPVTGLAIMQLYEKGLLDLDTSINDYLPFKIVNPKFRNSKITTRMLLKHKSGLIDNDQIYRSLNTIESGLPGSQVTLEEFVKGYFIPGGEWYDSEENFSEVAPGKEFSYSNTAFGLLGYLVERVSGQPFNEYCRALIFEPLAMNSAGWFSTEIDLENLAVHYHDGKRLKLYSYAFYPDGALKISIQDYAKFLFAMMNGGSYAGKRVLNKDTVKEMLPDDYDNLVWENNVLGEFFIDTGSQHLQGHTGGDPGAFAVTAFNPERKTAFLFFMNGTPRLLSLRTLNLISLLKRVAREADLF